MKRIAIVTSLILASAVYAQPAFWMIRPSPSNQILQQQLESQQRTEAMTRQMLEDQQHERDRATAQSYYDIIDTDTARIHNESEALRKRNAARRACIDYVNSHTPRTVEEAHRMPHCADI